jgi:hypothetical protein
VNGYTEDHWRQALSCVSGAGWAEYEPESPLEEAVLQAYTTVEKIDGNEGAVSAAIDACALLWKSWEPDAFIGMARAFMCSYPDMGTVEAQYIHENYPGTEPEWFKDDAPVWDGMVSDDEIVVDADEGVFFFAKPGTDRYRMLVDVSRETKGGAQ